MMKKLDLVKLLLDFLVHLIFLFVDEIVVAIDVVKYIETVDYNYYYYFVLMMMVLNYLLLMNSYLNHKY